MPTHAHSSSKAFQAFDQGDRRARGDGWPPAGRTLCGPSLPRPNNPFPTVRLASTPCAIILGASIHRSTVMTERRIFRRIRGMD
ncbi:MAG TPA: hypothetical protein VF265_05655, partial [Nevskiaceae bacterium]